MAEDFERIRANVQKMVGQRAPESDIDGYLQTEGMTPDAFRARVEQPAPAWKPYAEQEPIHSTDGTGWYKLRPDGSRMSATPPNNANGIAFRDIPRRLDDMARSFADYASFGLANKAEAALNTATKGGDYQTNLATERARSEAVPPAVKVGMGTLGVAASPITRGIGAAADMVLPTTLEGAAGVASRYANSATQGGLIGGGLGAMEAPEGQGWEGFKHGAKIGAGTGVASRLLAELLGAAWNTSVATRTDPAKAKEAAMREVADRLKKSGLSPDMARRVLDEDPTLALADLTPDLQKWAVSNARMPGTENTLALDRITGRQGTPLSVEGGAAGRVAGAVNEGLIPEAPGVIQRAAQAGGAGGGDVAAFASKALSDPTAANYAAALSKMRSAESSPIWKDIEARNPSVYSDKLAVMLESPEVKRGLAVGLRTEAAQAAANGTKFDPGQFGITDFAADGSPILGKTPTFKTLQMGKQGLDDMVFGAKPGDGILTKDGDYTKLGSALLKLRNSFVNEMKGLVPGYADALKTWSGPTQANSMIELGQKLAKGDYRATADLLSDLTENELQFVKIGAADQLGYLARQSTPTQNPVGRIFNSQAQGRNLRMIFGNEKAFDRFRETLGYENSKFSTFADLTKGSQTAERLAGMENASPGETVLSIGADLASGPRGIARAARENGSALKDWLTSQPKEVRKEIVDLMLNPDSGQNAATLDALKNLQRPPGIFGGAGGRLPMVSGALGVKVLPSRRDDRASAR